MSGQIRDLTRDTLERILLTAIHEKVCFISLLPVWAQVSMAHFIFTYICIYAFTLQLSKYTMHRGKFLGSILGSIFQISTTAKCSKMNSCIINKYQEKKSYIMHNMEKIFIRQ